MVPPVSSEKKMVGLKLPNAAIGFTGEVIFFLVGVTGIGAAVESSGLAGRAARAQARSPRGSTARLFVQMIAGFPVLALLVPSAITRNAVLIPAYRDALAAMGIGQKGRAGRAVMLKPAPVPAPTGGPTCAIRRRP